MPLQGIAVKPFTRRFVVERVTGIEPALSAWEVQQAPPLAALTSQFRYSLLDLRTRRHPRLTLAEPTTNSGTNANRWVTGIVSAR
jgi:hypothetical protein